MKTLIIDAIVGIGLLDDHAFAAECEKTGMARHTGNQWNPEWKWSRKALEACSLETLQELYEALRHKREAYEAAQAANLADHQSRQSSLILQ